MTAAAEAHSRWAIPPSERRLLSGLIARPELAERTQRRVGREDFRDPLLAVLLEALADTETTELSILLGEVQRRQPSDRWPAVLAELVDDGEGLALTDQALDELAQHVRAESIRRQLSGLHRRLAKDPDDAEVVERVRQLEAERAEIGAKARPASERRKGLEAVAFSGARLCALLERPAPDPVHAGIPPRGHFTAILAPSFSGKTSLELWLAMAYAAGVAPWEGAPVLGPGRVLIYSLDEAPEQVARRVRGLSTFHPAGRLERYAERLVVIGPDREIDPEALEGLRFDEAGLATLARWLTEAEEAGAPFVATFCDAYADLVPAGESENDNGVGTAIGGALERLAVRHDCAVVLIHHVGKPKADSSSDEPRDIRFMGRGASSLVAKARTVFSLEVVPGLPHVRRVRGITNLGRPPAPKLFAVCDPTASAEEILFFKPVDPLADYDPAAVLTPGEEIPTNELARRLAGEALPGDRDPPGEMKRLAAQLRERWREAGLVTVQEGKRNAKLVRLADTGVSQ